MHGDPEHLWNLPLAVRTAMSRSNLAQSFKETVGEPPDGALGPLANEAGQGHAYTSYQAERASAQLKFGLATAISARRTSLKVECRPRRLTADLPMICDSKYPKRPRGEGPLSAASLTREQSRSSAAEGRFRVLPSAEGLAGKQRRAVDAQPHHRFG
jgi:hypothetical protein